MGRAGTFPFSRRAAESTELALSVYGLRELVISSALNSASSAALRERQKVLREKRKILSKRKLQPTVQIRIPPADTKSLHDSGKLRTFAYEIIQSCNCIRGRWESPATAKNNKQYRHKPLAYLYIHWRAMPLPRCGVALPSAQRLIPAPQHMTEWL